MGGGLSFVYSIFVEFTIRNLGWRHAFLALSFILMATLLPLLFLLFFYRPQDKGLAAYGAEDSQPLQPQFREKKGGDAHLRRRLKFCKHDNSGFSCLYALYWGIADIWSWLTR
jgi:hypothetical protein